MNLRIEGAAGVAVAAWEMDYEKRNDRVAIIVICGGNISLEKLKGVI